MTDSDNSWSPSIINKQLRKRLENHESARLTRHLVGAVWQSQERFK